MKNNILISAVDVGKYENLGVAWNQTEEISKENFIEQFINRFQKKGIIAVEAPLFIPADKFSNLAKSRIGKIGGENYKIDQIENMPRPWSISASFPCGIQFLSIFFQAFPFRVQIFTDYDEFEKCTEGILICEAFISGGNPILKGEKRKSTIEDFYRENINRHNHDAQCAVKLLENLLSNHKPEIKQIFCDKYLNIPFFLIQENPKLIFDGDVKKGLIVKSPKPCFKNYECYQEIVQLSL